jgi:hypothetical protein
MQEQLPNGGTLIPLIFASDKIQLTNFSGDRAAWLVYMTIGNLDKNSQREALKRAWVLVGLLPEIPKNSKTGLMPDLFHDCITAILKPLKFPDPETTLIQEPGELCVYDNFLRFEWKCSDGNIHHCFPVIDAWIADYEEQVVISQIISRLCPHCEIPVDKMERENNDQLAWGDRCSIASEMAWIDYNVDWFKKNRTNLKGNSR